jgi:hypothetical protein
MKKTWITLRMDEGQPPAVALYGTDDITDVQVVKALADAGKAAAEPLAAVLNGSAAKTLAAINHHHESGMARLARAAASGELGTEKAQG